MPSKRERPSVPSTGTPAPTVKIPRFLIEAMSPESVKQLAATVYDYSAAPGKPAAGEVAVGMYGSRLTGPFSSLNLYRDVGYYNTDDIPLTVLDTMRRDSQVALAMAIVKYPIVNLGFTVNCGNEAIKAFVERVMTPIWSTILRDNTLAMDYGFNASEKVWEERMLEIDPGKNKHKIRQNFIVLKKLKPLYPTTVTVDVDQYGNLSQINQTATGLARKIQMDRMKAMIVTYNKEYGNMFGRSRMTPAYEPWYWKIISTQFFLRWLERLSVPPYKIRHPGGKVETSSGTMSAQDAALRMAEALSSFGNVTLPSRRDENGNLLWDIESVTSQTASGVTLEDVVENVWNLAIIRGMLIPDKKVLGGIDEKSATNIFLSTIGDFVETLETDINREIIEPMVKWNFPKGEIEECWLNIDDIDFQKREEMRKLFSKIMDLSATFVKNTGGVPFDVFPDLRKIHEVLDIPYRPATIYQMDTIDSSGQKVDPKKIIGKTGPEKGELTSGNQSRLGRNGDPRDQDKQDDKI